MYYVYILQSRFNKDQIYVGSTNDLKRRIEEHNDGKGFSTNRYRPWMLFYYEAYKTEKLARMREKRLKYNGNAIRELKKRIGLALPSTTFQNTKSGAGFTLVELLVVVGTIGILAAATLVILNPIDQIQKGRDTQRKADLEQIKTALDAYYQDNGKYPQSLNFRITRNNIPIEWGEPWVPYMVKLPRDSNGSKSYLYYTFSAESSPQKYWLYAELERGSKDPQACSGGRCSPPTGVISTDFDSMCDDVAITCNYGVSSSNTTVR